MTTEKIKELVSNSELSAIQKNVMNGFIDRAKEEKEKGQQDKALIEAVATEKFVSEVLISTDEVKIYTIYQKYEWDKDCPYRIIYLEKETGNWKRIHTLAPTLDMAYLIYLEHKYNGLNSQFSLFASRMLGIVK